MANNELKQKIAEQTAGKKIALIGSSGNVGHKGLALLIESGKAASITAFDKKIPRIQNLPEQVKVLSDESGDITNSDAVYNAVAGNDTVVCAVGVPRVTPKGEKPLTPYDIEENGMKNIVQAALKTGVKHIIYISVLAVRLGDKLPPFHHGAVAKYRAEQALIKSGISYTILRPTGYFQDYREMFQYAISAKYDVVDKGTTLAQPIDEQNIAEMVIASIGNEQARNKIIAAGGSEIFDRIELAKVFSKIIKKEITPISLTPEEYKKTYFNSDLMLFRAVTDSVLSKTEMETLKGVYPYLKLTRLEDYLNNPDDPVLKEYFQKK
ncbi:MAG: NAD(P)H-binding protein [Candidatus Schekmanbacteria bacterium]|nr:NAD(P)H-binding protein [Candidatus Schekmanbacteria bacterium]